MSRLHELAREWGVETLDLSILPEHDRDDEVLVKRYCKPRPDLEIAHEILGKLPMRTLGYDLHFTSDKVSPYWTATRWESGLHRELVSGTFIDCVIALAERAKR